jgi:PAS domain S-box-containing protein
MRKPRLPMPSSAHRAMKILAIDDEPVIRESIAAYLEDSGFKVFQAGDGKHGLALFRKQPPDLILLDLRMPEMDGLAFLETLRQEASDIPVIVVSGTGMLQDAIEALRAGAQDFVTKPILDMAVLEHAIQNALERARLRQENRRYRQHLEDEIGRRTADLTERTQDLETSNRKLQKEIAQRKQAEATLRRREQKFRELADLLPQPVFETDQDERFSFINRYGREILSGGDADLIEQMSVLDIFGTETHPQVSVAIRQIMAGKGPVEFEAVVHRKNRTLFPAMVYASPIIRSGALVGMRGILFDLTAIRKAEEALRASEAQLRQENLRLRSSLKGVGRFGRIIGKSQPMHEVYQVILKAAASSANVIIYGESGTGKELVAHTIHELSDRNRQAFVPVNCGAIPENLLESEFFGHKKGAFTGAHKDKPGFLAEADGGTLFLDEIGEINPNLQVKLLRAIEGGGYTPIGSNETIIPDIRIVAATNRNLTEEVRKGTLRDDFFYRIHIIPIHLPPLRSRREDIPLLVQHFLQSLSDSDTLSVMPEHAIQAMIQRDWPGNVRELQNAVHRFITLNSVESVDVSPLPPTPPSGFTPLPIDATLTLKAAMARCEKQYLLQMLDTHQWHRARVATLLGIDRRTLFRKMKDHGL